MWDYEDPLDTAASQSSATSLASADTPEIGANMTWYHNAGHIDPVIFLNQFKGAWPWQGVVGTTQDIVFDAEGYAENTPENGMLFSKILKRSNDLDGLEPFDGMFRIYGEGSGKLRIDQQARGDLLQGTETDALPTEVIDGKSYWYVDFDYDIADDTGTSLGDVRLMLVETQTGDHIRNLSLVHHSHLDDWRAGETFAPELLSDLEGLDTLRFMEWTAAHKYNKMGSGDWTPEDASQRFIGTDHFTYNTRAGDNDWSTVFLASAPIETIVALANAVDANPWIALPVDISDTQMQLWAQYVDAALDPDLEVYWEYGNELWNNAHGFDAYRYAELMAQLTFGADTPGGIKAVANWDAYRGPQLFDIIAAETSAPDQMNYVAAMWAHDGPVRDNGSLVVNSYTNLYWAAEEAQKMIDAPSRPSEIITDYAVGLYAGAGLGGSGDNAYVLNDIMARHDTDSDRAKAFADWLTFGMYPDSFVEIGMSALDSPVHLGTITPDSDISVAGLVRADRQAGHDVVGDLNEILRLQNDKLQYRGVNADRWTTVATFDEDLGRSIGRYLNDVSIVGAEFRGAGAWHPGIQGGLLYQTDRRLDSHVEFIESAGLDFLGYEGGVHYSEPRADTLGLIEAFEDEGWYAVVMDAYYAEMGQAGLDLYAHYMTHDRSVSGGGHWGARDYVGEPLDEAGKAKWLVDTIAAQNEVVEAPDDITVLPGANGIEAESWKLPDGASLTANAGLLLPPGNASAIGTFLRSDPAALSEPESYRLDMSFSLPEPGRVMVLLQSLGGGANELLRQELYVDGDVTFSFSFDDSLLDEQRDRFRLTLRRVGSGDADVPLLVDDFSLALDLQTGLAAAALPGT